MLGSTMKQHELRQWLASGCLPGEDWDDSLPAAELSTDIKQKITALSSADEHFAEPREDFVLCENRYYDLSRSTLLAQRPIQDDESTGWEMLYESPEGNYFTYRQTQGEVEIFENIALSLFGSGLLLVPLAGLPHLLLTHIGMALPLVIVVAMYILLSGGMFSIFSYNDYNAGLETKIEEGGQPLLQFTRLTDSAVGRLCEQVEGVGIEDSEGRRLLKWGPTFLAFDDRGHLHHISREHVKKMALRSDRRLAHALFPELEEG